MLYLTSYVNPNIPNSRGIGAFDFIFLFSIFYLIYFLFGIKFYKQDKVKKLIIYSSIGYMFFLSLLLFFLTNILNGRELYFTLNKYNFNKEYFLKSEYNITPFYILKFKDDNNTFFGFIFNIICFIPLGALLPALLMMYNKKINIYYILLSFLLISIVIEALQFILPINRRVDIDDIISNTLGNIIGFLIFLIIKKRLKITQLT